MNDDDDLKEEVPLKKKDNSSSNEVIPFVDAEIDEDDGALVITLYVPVMGIHVDFKFRFLPVEIKITDILQTQLRDAEEQIELLKNALRKNRDAREFVSLRSSGGSCNAIVTWNAPGPYNSAPLIYKISENLQAVQILVRGWYQVSCRLSGTDSAGQRCVTLKKNGTDVSQAFNGFNTGYNGSVSICDILEFAANDSITVYYHANGNLHNNVICTYFSILKVA